MYGLIQRILCLIFIIPHYNVTVPLLQLCMITNGPLYVVSHLYTELLVSMTLSLTLQSFSTPLLFLRILSLLTCV